MGEYDNFNSLGSCGGSGYNIKTDLDDIFSQESDDSQYSTISHELQECLTKINHTISLEAESSDLIVALFKIKQNLIIAINLADKNQDYLPPSSPFDSNYVSYNLDQSAHSSASFNPYDVEKKRSKPEDDKMLSIIKSTLQVPKVAGLREIVGLDDIKRVLKSLVVLPRTQPQLFQNRRTGNSVLLFGPPGTGKTRLVHALAAESRSILHCISASDVLSHYVGQTEKTIKALFQYLKENRQFAILFIDEIDGFCRKRTDQEQEHTRRIKTELMCQMTSYEDCKDIFIICATNCPWDLDSAILRRFHQRIYVPLPNKPERMEFFRYFTRFEELDYSYSAWGSLLDKTEGCSGSDLSDIVQNALNMPINELEDCKIWKHTIDGLYEPAITEEDFSNIICSELSDLPPNSVRARKATLMDFFNAACNVRLTVSADDIKKFEVFNGSS